VHFEAPTAAHQLLPMRLPSSDLIPSPLTSHPHPSPFTLHRSPSPPLATPTPHSHPSISPSPLTSHPSPSPSPSPTSLRAMALPPRAKPWLTGPVKATWPRGSQGHVGGGHRQQGRVSGLGTAGGQTERWRGGREHSVGLYIMPRHGSRALRCAQIDLVRVCSMAVFRAGCVS